METNLHRKDESSEQKRAAVAKTAGIKDASSLRKAKGCWLNEVEMEELS